MGRPLGNAGWSAQHGAQTGNQHGMQLGNGRVPPQLTRLLSNQQGQGGLRDLVQNGAAGQLLSQLAALVATQQEGLLDPASDMAGGGLTGQPVGMGSQHAQGGLYDSGQLDMLSDAAAALSGGQRQYENGLIPSDSYDAAAANAQQVPQQRRQRQSSAGDLNGPQPGPSALSGPPTVTADAAAQLYQRQVRRAFQLRTQALWLGLVSKATQLCQVCVLCDVCCGCCPLQCMSNLELCYGSMHCSTPIR